MNVDHHTYKETETSNFILEHKKDDKELLIFLNKYDSIMLNQLKVFFSEPQLTFKHTCQNRMYCDINNVILLFFQHSF